jgi:hypothetical protein
MPRAKSSRLFAFLLGACVFADVRLALAFPQLLPYATLALVGLGVILFVVARRSATNG